MDIHITGRHVKVTPALRDFVESKLDRARKHFDDIVWAQMVLTVEKRSHQAEVVLHAKRQTFRALATAGDLYAAVDLVSDKIDAQLKRYKERLRDHHKAPIPDGELAPLPAEAAPPFAVVKQAVRPMDPAEAAREMESLGQAFRVYLDRATGQLQVVYRRADESYAIVQPVKKGRS